MSKKKIVIGALAAVVLLVVGFCVSVPVVNDLFARQVADELGALPLPENTRIVEKKSMARKLYGNGNGMQYMGALLIESGLSLEELEEFYSKSAIQCRVSRQDGQKISVTEHGNYSFKTKVTTDGFYIVYALGDNNSFLGEVYARLDIRGR